MATGDEHTLTLTEVLRFNTRRLRELRGLTVRGLAARLEAVGSVITSSSVSKIESGTRAISVPDWSALSIALNAPMTAFVIVPDVDDREAWSPRTAMEDRQWAADINLVEVAENVYCSAPMMDKWLAGQQWLRSDIAPWTVGESALEDFIHAGTPSQRRLHQVFRHPAMAELTTLTSLVTEVLTGKGHPANARLTGMPEGNLGVTRKAMADMLKEHTRRLSVLVDLLSDAVTGDPESPARTPGKYMDDEGWAHGA